MYRLHIANKNYSSWSLRPWVLMSELEIEFEERSLRFGDIGSWERYRSISRSGKVPCLIDGDLAVWDSLAITEYLAERHRGVWPAVSGARAWARSAAAEIHSGFTELRNRCSMSCGVRVRLNEFPPSLGRDIADLGNLWNDGLRRFGGPWLAGGSFTAILSNSKELPEDEKITWLIRSLGSKVNSKRRLVAGMDWSPLASGSSCVPVKDSVKPPWPLKVIML